MPKSAAAKSASLYDAHPGIAMVQKWAAELKPKTGRTLEQWIALAQKEGPAGHRARAEWLKSRHNVPSNSAWWIADYAEGKDVAEDTPEGYLAVAIRYVDEQCAGKKADPRPIYEELLALAKSFGPDVKACPCQTIVPLYRNHVFAQLKAATNTRVDLGLCFKDFKGKLPKRLVDMGGLAKKDRITHRMEVSSQSQIDADLKKWLRAAYELDV